MSFLKLLESLRTPFFDFFFSAVTHLGEETVFLVLGLIFFWCIDKYEGYYLLSVGFIGLLLNQYLKMIFRIERPWVKDETFTIVESARPQAIGYSFPSGHTQTSVGVFGGLARWHKNKPLRYACVILCILIPFSRLYLGVHTPLDVAASLIIALVLVFGIFPLIKRAMADLSVIRFILLGIILLALGLLAYLYLGTFPKIDPDNNYGSTLENAYKMLGSGGGILLAFELDRRYIKFSTKATVFGQILKMLCGLVIALAIKEGLKALLAAILPVYIAGTIRYFFLLLFIGAVWPLTFKAFAKIGKKE